MGRWEPDARGRLEQAAMELYSERGFEQTTVAEIAAQAGLTERTYFRHFADKREVLFGGQDELCDTLVAAAAGAPESASPIDAAGAGLEAIGAAIQERRDRARQRQRIIDANRELQARELIKLASFASALADALRARGVADPTASLTAEVAIAAFRTAFRSWVRKPTKLDLPELVRDSLEQLKALTAVRQTA